MAESSMGVLGLFPTPVGKVALGREIAAEEMDFMLSRPTRRNLGNERSIENDVLGSPEMAGLRGFIQSSVNEYFESIYAPALGASLRITQSWLNVSEPGQWHHKHEHPNSFVSGVFYVKADREKDRITFYQSGYRHILIKTEKFNLYNSLSWWVEVQTGDLLLFPSYLTHEVMPVTGDSRISLSFNTFPIGCIGDSDNLAGLELLDLKG